MRRTLVSILALTAIFSTRAVHAQAEAAKEKQKTQLFALLEHARALARWMPNESSFLTVLDRAQDRLAGTKESDLAPLLEFDPYFDDLTATLTRMEGRIGTVQTPVEICDPSRRKDLFLLFLDVLDADGQGQVQAKICEKIASEEQAEGSLSQACVVTSLGLLAARSVHDQIVVCDPSLTRASDASAAGLEKLSVELAGVQAGVQASVRSVKSEMTQAMTVVAGQMIDVSSLQTKQLGDLTVRLEIEKALQQGSPYGSLYLPEANGGRLEIVRAIVDETIGNVLRSGESANQASEKLAAGDEQVKAGHFKQAFRLYSEAYKAAVALPPKPR